LIFMPNWICTFIFPIMIPLWDFIFVFSYELKYDKVLVQQLLKKHSQKKICTSKKMHEECNNYFRITFQKKNFNIWWWNNFYVMFGYGFHVEYIFYSKLLQQKYHLYRYNETCKWFFNLIKYIWWMIKYILKRFFNLIKYMVNDKIYVEMIF